MSQFNIIIDSETLVTERLLVFKGVEYAVSDINSLTFWETKQSINYVTALRMRGLTVGFGAGGYEKPKGVVLSLSYCILFNCEENRDVIVSLLRSFDS